MKLEAIIAGNIRRLRSEAKITQADLADGSGLKTTSIAAIEQGHRAPSIATVAVIAEALEVEPWQLLKPSGR